MSNPSTTSAPASQPGQTSRPPHASDGPAATRVPMRWLLASLFIIAMLVPHLVILVHPIEDFPLTCMPMFSATAGPDRHRYRFHFMAEVAGNAPEQIEITSRGLGLDESRFMRFFFYDVYYSVNRQNPVTRYQHDDRARFEERLSRFFQSVVRIYHQRHAEQPEIKRIHLLLERTHPSPETREIGRYDAHTGQFTHLWGAQP